jgi:prepilin-type N-terminal cleavage/methylation domain-containing protein
MTFRVQTIWTQDGFTLVELSIVILLLSFILLFSIPRYTDILGGQRLNSSGHLITGMVRYVYDQATAKKRIYRLNYSLKDGQLWISSLNDEGEFVDDQSPLGRRRNLLTGVSFEDIITPTEKVKEGHTYTQFFPTGLVDKGIVHLRSADGAQLTLFLRTLSGRVKIEQGYREEEVVAAH